MKNMYKILFRKPVKKKPLGRPREDNLRILHGKVWTGCIWLRTGTSGNLL
jgi:hypothetical protein